jgi:acyl-CoA thioesterase-1
MKRRLILWAAGGAVLIAAVGALFVPVNSPGRQLVWAARNAECYKQPQAHGISAIGDSITAGSGKPGLGFLPRDSWLGQALCDTDVPFSYNGGIPNQTTEQIVARLPDVLSHDPAVVVIYAGTNDVYLRDLSDESVERLRGMITDVREAGAVPVVATLPPIADEPETAYEFNKLIRDLAEETETRLIDFYPVLVDGVDYKDGFTKEGLHPSEKGAEAMGEVALPVVMDALADWQRTH